MSTKKKKSSKKKRRMTKIIIFAVEIILLLIVLAILYVNLKLDKADTGNKEDIEKTEKNELSKETQEIQAGYTTVAIFGLDNRSNGNFNSGNSDVIILASINNDTKEVKLVSVYRDTYLNRTDGDGYGKCNAAFNRGGVSQAISMLNVNLDLDIDNYVIVDFNAVSNAVDILGGVEVDLDNTEVYGVNGYSLENYAQEVARVTGKTSYPISYNGPGMYLLDGVHATAYARIRYTAGSDYKRTERQREVIQAMVTKAKKSDLATIDNLADAVLEDIKTSLTKTEILGLVADAFSYSLGENTGFPFDLEARDLGKAGDCVVPLDLASNVKQLHAFLFETEEYEVSDAVQKISDEIVKNTGLSAKDIP